MTDTATDTVTDTATLLAYLLTAGAIVVSPGPDTTLIVRHTLTSGLPAGLGTVAGTLLGLSGHTLATVLGLSLLIAASPTALAVIAVIGAAYLAWLGAQAFRAGVISFGNVTASVGAPYVSAGRALRDGLMSNLFNPKVILLFLSLMPQFVRPEAGSVPKQLAVMGGLLIAMSLFWNGGLALAAKAIRGWLARPAVQHGINWITGAILLGFAGLMLYDHVL
ncbi:MAG: LysE family translocator [Alphaproteobacteria bacterium]|nr:LysE family translocator [Alphaproteobacteria bacterium]MCB9928230.1 LysE family translocator [Alphaproteobacteria bacterium]